MRHSCVLILAVLLFTASGRSAARAQAGGDEEASGDLARQVQDVVEKLGALEKSLPAPADGKSSVWSKLSMNLGGYINLDASYDLAATSTGNYIRWIESEAGEEDDDEFNATVNATRLWLAIDGPGTESLATDAYFEIDFYGGGGENSPNPRIRHAYLEMKWPDLDFELLFGQTWDVIQPLHTPTVNYSVGWWMGNIGFRRPQGRATQKLHIGDVTLELVAAAARTISDPLFDEDVGGDSGFPTGQARAEIQFRPFPDYVDKPVVLGISGHYGEQECDEFSKDIESFSYGIHARVPVHEKVVILGEAWTGKAVCVYLGGIGQGINRTLERAIEAAGGWAAVSLGPFGKWRFNAGGLVDNPQNSDLNDRDRSKNSSYFGNVIYAVNSAVTVGFEVVYTETDYKNWEDGDSIRFQTQFRFSF